MVNQIGCNICKTFNLFYSSTRVPIKTNFKTGHFSGYVSRKAYIDNLLPALGQSVGTVYV